MLPSSPPASGPAVARRRGPGPSQSRLPARRRAVASAGAGKESRGGSGLRRPPRRSCIPGLLQESRNRATAVARPRATAPGTGPDFRSIACRPADAVHAGPGAVLLPALIENVHPAVRPDVIRRRHLADALPLETVGDAGDLVVTSPPAASGPGPLPDAAALPAETRRGRAHKRAHAKPFERVHGSLRPATRFGGMSLLQ